MTTWTNIGAYTAGQLIDATELNKLRTNVEYLLRPGAGVVTWTSNYTTTSTAFVDVDSSNLSMSVSVQSTRLLVGLAASFEHTVAGGQIYLDVTIGGLAQGHATNGILHPAVGNTGHHGNASFVFPIFSLAGGVHTVRLRWRTGSGTVTLHANGRFWAREV